MSYVSIKRSLVLMVMAYFILLHREKISYYGSYPAGTSSCSLDPIPPLLKDKKWILAAVSKEDFLNSLVCGTCLRISIIDLASSEDPDAIFAAVIDQCNDCKKGEISLYTEGKGTRKANYEAVDCNGSSNGSLLVRVKEVEKSKAKFQINNSLLPIVSLECFDDGKWKCLPRDIDNFFVFDDFSAQNRMQFRVTSISGEKIGFSVDIMDARGTVYLYRQFLPFSTATQPSKNVPMQCQERAQIGAIESNGNLEQRNKTYEHEHVNMSRGHNDVNGQEKRPAGRQSADSNLTKQIETPHTTLNASFCRGKADGAYMHEDDCERFILCAQGKTLNKKCPDGLRYNARESVCDWSRNVRCNENTDMIVKPSSNEIASNSDNDDEVYTKKFIGRKKINETIVEN